VHCHSHSLAGELPTKSDNAGKSLGPDHKYLEHDGKSRNTLDRKKILLEPGKSSTA
jgi:hypothetical protein